MRFRDGFREKEVIEKEETSMTQISGLHFWVEPIIDLGKTIGKNRLRRADLKAQFCTC